MHVSAATISAFESHVVKTGYFNGDEVALTRARAAILGISSWLAAILPDSSSDACGMKFYFYLRAAVEIFAAALILRCKTTSS